MGGPGVLNPRTPCILALDTSTPRGKCAVLSFAGEAGEASAPEDIRISRTLLPQVEELLDANNIPANMIRAVGVSVGPGTFTGLRVGLSFAKGLALGLGCPLYGFSSLETMAMDALLRRMRARRVLPDYILPYRDAGHGELFTALFQVSANPESSLSHTLLRVRADAVTERGALRPPADGHTLAAGRRKERPETLGTGASGEAVAHHEVDSSAVAAAWLARAAIESRTPPPGADVSLNYCRKPQAQTKWADPQG